MKRQSNFGMLAAAVTAAMGLGAGAFGSAAQVNPSASKGAILHMPRGHTQRDLELLRAVSATKFRRKPWPFNGKNRAQRLRLASAFSNF